MPTIQQERGVKSVKGLPVRWGLRAYRELSEARAGALSPMPERYLMLARLIDDVTAAPLPLDSTDAQICVFAERFASECATESAFIHDIGALRVRLCWMVANRGLTPPDFKDDRQVVLRCMDPAWWRRNLRKVCGRHFEHAAMRLGFVSSRVGAYASNETVKRRIGQNNRNAKMLRAVRMRNELGQEYALADLANKGISNKAIRRGELMLRMAGCEDIAAECGHVGIFVTLTCPSKYHAVLEKSGQPNPKYNGASAREGQSYMVAAWGKVRKKNGRDGIAPYGFRIAEPHHDGCPHWHMLFFCPTDQVEQFKANLRRYALAEDGDEAGAHEYRVKIVRIEAGKGTAAGYIAKYVGKNIDDAHVGAHLGDDGSIIETDLVGDQVIRPCQRVEAWAGQWGIRQFQAIGQPPVTVWREMRRVAREKLENAPDHVLRAWDACQRIEGTDAETGEVVVTKPADYAEYIRAQGGVNVGQDYRIGVAKTLKMCEGRYGLTERPAPVGVCCRAAPDQIYASTRYEWRRVGVAVEFRLPGSPVNNCPVETAPHWAVDAPWPEEIPAYDDSEFYANCEFEFYDKFGDFNVDLARQRMGGT